MRSKMKVLIVFCCGVPEPHIQIKHSGGTGKIDNI